MNSTSKSCGYTRHECEHLPDKGVYIEFSDDGETTWKLYIQREATESDLEENHYLDMVGESIWTTMLEITHCPYCGIQLSGLKNINKGSYGKFQHIYSSGWSSKIM